MKDARRKYYAMGGDGGHDCVGVGSLFLYVVAEGEGEAGAAFVGGVNTDVASVGKDCVLDDGESEACAARLAAAAFVHSVETFENAGLVLLGDAYAVVAEGEVPVG